MSLYEDKTKRAMKFFNLTQFFNFKDLERAYKRSKKVINDMNDESRNRGKPFTLSSSEIDEFYLILYKELIKNYVKGMILKNIEFTNENNEAKILVRNLDEKIVDFYSNNLNYKIELNRLLETIKIDLRLFEEIEIKNAKSTEEVDVLVENFVVSLEEQCKGFANEMISLAKNNALYTHNNIIFQVDMDKITTVFSLIIETYNVIQSMFSKKSSLSKFIEIAREYEAKIGNDGELTDEELQRRRSLKDTALGYYSMLVNEKDPIEFIRIYDEGILKISEIAEFQLEQEITEEQTDQEVNVPKRIK